MPSCRHWPREGFSVKEDYDMKILMTAFEPFGKDNMNSSLEVLKRIVPPDGIDLIRLQVPTVFTLAGETVMQRVEKERPACVICLGQAAGRSAVTPERVAINLRDASIPDNAGRQPTDEPIVSGGPAAIFATLPIKKMVSAAKAAGLEAAVSNTAGTFVCNDLMYTLLYSLEKDYPGIKGGFIHVPACRSEDGSPERSAMTLDSAVLTIESMLKAIQEDDIGIRE